MTIKTPRSNGSLWARFRFSVIGSLLASPPPRGELLSVPARKWASIPEPGEPFWNVTIPVGDRVRRSQMAD